MIFSKYNKYFYLFLLIGLLVYFPVLLNNFTYDDYPFILQNPMTHQFNIAALLGPNIFNAGTFYRPIPAIYFAAFYALFQQQAFFYHFFQLSLHIINTALLFIFFLRFFPRLLASFLSLIFLVHPINVESVALISSTTSEIYFLFGISALLYGTQMEVNNKKIFFIFTLLFLSLLTKETGILFLFLLILYRYLYKLNQLRIYILSGVFISVIYLVLRIFVGKVIYQSSESLIPIANIPFLERLLNIPSIIIYYLQTFLIPRNLSIWQIWIKTFSIQDFVLFILISLSLLIGLLYYVRKINNEYNEKNIQNKNSIRGYIFFVSWYVFGMVLLLQIIPLDMTVADRWFYFPIVGILGIIGIVLKPWWLSFQKHKKIYLTIVIIVVSLLSIRSFVRTLDWRDNVTLFSHDIQSDQENPLMLVQLAGALQEMKRTDEALIYAKKAVSLSQNTTTLSYLGYIYKNSKQYDKAIETYSQLIQIANISSKTPARTPSGMMHLSDQRLLDAYANLADIYRINNRPNDEMQIINEGLRRFPSSSQLYYFLALREYKLGNYDNALSAAKKSHDLAPNKLNSSLYNRLQNSLPSR